MSNSKKNHKEAKQRLKRERQLRERRRERSAPIGASFVKPDVRREIRYITQLAQPEDSRIVTVGNLVLFSTRTRDDWLLDPEDNFVVCLSREGEPQPFRIIDARGTFAIEGTASPKMACLLRS